MKRVTIVNLAGTAYHLESDGAELLDAWFDDARERLADDPDRDELMLDFERAVADRCQTLISGDREVVTAEQARAIVAALGTVQPAAATEDPADTDDAGEQSAASVSSGSSRSTDEDGWRERKLYRLTGKDDEIIAGVCAGVAAYLRVDVTIVRIAFVLLALITTGLMVILYLAMAVFVPEADTPGKRAAAHGYGESAQEMIARARENAGPAMATAGSAIRNAGHLLARILTVIFSTIAWTFGSIAVVQIIWLFINGGGIQSAFDPGTDRWMIALWIAAVGWIVAGFAMAIAGGFKMLDGRPKRPRSRSGDLAIGTLWTASMIAAFVAVPAIPATHSQQIRDAADGQGRIDVFGTTLCLDNVDDDHPRASDTCRSGDVVWRWSDDDRHDDDRWDDHRD